MTSYSKKVLMIRDAQTGLFSTGGYTPSWVPAMEAKRWEKMGQVVAHLKLYERGQYPSKAQKIPETWEVVEFELTLDQTGSTPAAKKIVTLR